MSKINELRPHERTADNASVSYRAHQIRALFKELDTLREAVADIAALRPRSGLVGGDCLDSQDRRLNTEKSTT